MTVVDAEPENDIKWSLAEFSVWTSLSFSLFGSCYGLWRCWCRPDGLCMTIRGASGKWGFVPHSDSIFFSVKFRNPEPSVQLIAACTFPPPPLAHMQQSNGEIYFHILARISSYELLDVHISSRSQSKLRARRLLQDQINRNHNVFQEGKRKETPC